MNGGMVTSTSVKCIQKGKIEFIRCLKGVFWFTIYSVVKTQKTVYR